MATAPVSHRAFRAFHEVANRRLNFPPASLEQAATDPAWKLDRRRALLPAEPPGPPQPEGPYAVARRLLAAYQFADPSVVRAVYDPTSDLEGRTMLLVGRFAGLRFHMGVRVGGVREQSVELEGRPAHRFRWHYRTLEGHLERGQMDYELVKWTETGVLELRIRAWSQPAPMANPLLRLGFAVFGRWVQLRFYDHSLARMQALVAEGVSRQKTP